ncbi:hypothetical protein LC949_07715, partial [Enterococcus faecium]|nr:hypothetical protein [Enterococcus faecium]MCH3456738.1 hypothetical protein [Enterococcus faecium]MCH3481985.1 hypothetical protein [Enterococcus faecium]MCH3550738.1 hypothetical protein [Enterococcus faecium]MCH3553849.1 hypothetical protein [Enterococcus faecium]
LPFVLFLDIIAITPCIRFHKSIIKEKTVDIIHKMDFVYSLRRGWVFPASSFFIESYRIK